MENILIVEDNKDMQFVLSNILKDDGYNVLTADDGWQAQREIKKGGFDLVLLDIKLPDIDGMKLLEKIKQREKNLPIIMLTAYGDIKEAVKALKLGAYDYLTKPFNNDEIILVIKRALQNRYLSREVENLRKKLGERFYTETVMGESPAVQRVLKQVNMIAKTDMTVILQGDSGSGKELIAQMIHYKSLRSNKAFVAVDSGALPETLVESELFGCEKGAYTGADERREGKFEQADGGTLFLDEITNLVETAQVKLLRVIQERKIQRLGAKKAIDVDVRIIAATNADMAEAVKAGKFRSDLYHRLNEFVINLPALKDRKEDIPVLCNYFLNEANEELERKVKGFSTEALKFIINYNWPGNIRELRNVIKRGVLLSEEDKILPSVLPLEIIEFNHLVPPPIEMSDVYFEKNCVLRDISSNVERDVIKKALEEAHGSKTEAAKLLCISRKTLYRKMKNFNMV